MEEKKRRIIESSVALFAEKGYHKTSIQAIAERSGVSKGAFYLYFSSKQALTSEIVQYYAEQMLDEVTRINQSNQDPESKLIEQTALFLQAVSDHKGHVFMTLRDHTNGGEGFKHLIKDLHNHSFQAITSRLFEMYGDQIRPYLADCFVLYDGILQGYLKTIILYEADIDVGDLSHYIVHRFQSMIDALLKELPAPILSPDQLELTEQSVSCVNVFDELSEAISTLEIDEEKQVELYEIVELLKCELSKDKPNQVMIRSLIQSLESIGSLQDKIEKLNRYLGGTIK
ncbi:transcriptional regulator, TetR family [Pelagirhabdus alkalitolerans]|uniref:Transcriptional regulator, TetR family n=1 Tax=Pelagirhabdus alkalitolerans TaxID=1612202 RepID=A0A1G6GFT4_9BACI|nr:TetR/AcrR family transcriptional regulator [Pelagirhabdus alkalitolerans]SDB80882.1 transcriptional regulator, TetR family [Pelagirhabdus alkalitolerans]